jgi:uncharacterized integral membrane protein
MARSEEEIVQEEGRPADLGAQPAPEPPRRDRGTIVKVIVALVLLILFIIFVAGNSREVTVDLVFATAQVRLIWVFLGCALIGALIAFLLGRPGRRNTRKYIHELERRLGDRKD